MELLFNFTYIQVLFMRKILKLVAGEEGFLQTNQHKRKEKSNTPSPCNSYCGKKRELS